LVESGGSDYARRGSEPDAYGDANSDRNTQSIADCYRDTNSVTNPTNANPITNAHANRVAQSIAYSYTNCDPDANGNAYSDAASTRSFQSGFSRREGKRCRVELD
jgi:hypothetical protein